MYSVDTRVLVGAFDELVPNTQITVHPIRAR
jgi:hypothetical protein